MKKQNPKTIRINKFLSQSGVSSRRGADVLVEDKKVKINNKIAKLGDRVDEEKDIIEVDGKIIKLTKKFIYYAINKPIGYTSTVRDVNAEKLVIDLVPKEPRVYPVGRLDKDSIGLVLLTNDGDLTHKLTHPSFRHQKEYVIKFKPQTSNIKITKQYAKDLINKFIKGIKLEEGMAKFDRVEITEIDDIENIATINVILHQGWKRQIRRMFERIGHKVLMLERVRIGKLNLGEIKLGKFIQVERADII